MFALTGDIHHWLDVQDQRWLPAGVTEAKISAKYLQIVNGHGIVPTLFATGAMADAEADDLGTLVKNHRFELGGHTYSCYKPSLVYGASRRLLGLANGPRFLQRHDMGRAVRALERLGGRKVLSWRNHAYRQDRNTVALAAEHGLRSVSNVVEVGLAPSVAVTAAGPVAILAINTTPDHETLHPDGPGQQAVFANVGDWVDAVAAEVDRNESQGVPSVILAHPACMEVEDGMVAFERLLRHLKPLESVAMAELARHVLDRWKEGGNQ